MEDLRAKYPSLSQFNMTNFNPDVLVNDEFVIMRSASIDNVHKALKSGLWTR